MLEPALENYLAYTGEVRLTVDWTALVHQSRRSYTAGPLVSLLRAPSSIAMRLLGKSTVPQRDAQLHALLQRANRVTASMRVTAPAGALVSHLI